MRQSRATSGATGLPSCASRAEIPVEPTPVKPQIVSAPAGLCQKSSPAGAWTVPVATSIRRGSRCCCAVVHEIRTWPPPAAARPSSRPVQSAGSAMSRSPAPETIRTVTVSSCIASVVPPSVTTGPIRLSAASGATSAASAGGAAASAQTPASAVTAPRRALVVSMVPFPSEKRCV